MKLAITWMVVGFCVLGSAAHLAEARGVGEQNRRPAAMVKVGKVDPRRKAAGGVTVDPRRKAAGGVTVDPRRKAAGGATVDPRRKAAGGVTVDPRRKSASGGQR